MKKTMNLLRAIQFILLAFVCYQPAIADESWTQLVDSNGVKIYSMPATCNGQNVVLMKIVNENETGMSINWSVWGMAQAAPVNIGASATLEATCSDLPQLKVIALPGTEFSSFVSTFHVTQINSQQ